MTHSPNPRDVAGEFASARDAMVRDQLAARGIEDPRVLTAFRRVARERFMDPASRAAAYEDHAAPIGCGQTISQPFTVATMVAAAQISASDRVLEIGTGSGYGAAILACVADEVHTIERHAPLAQEAEQRLQSAGFANVHVHVGDGTLGWAPAAPYDAILVTAAADELPSAYRTQLARGGRIVIPMGSTADAQSMMRFTADDHVGSPLRAEDLGRYIFVPLVGACSWARPDDAHG